MKNRNLITPSNNTNCNSKDTKNEGINQVETDISLKELEQDLEQIGAQFLEETNSAKSSNKLPFPVEAFPEKVQTIINEFYKSYQLPKEYFGLGILTTCSGVIGNAYCLEYKRGYTIPTILYGAIVGSSSIGKTPALKLCLNPIFDIEKAYRKEYKEKFCEWERGKNESSNNNTKPIRKDLMLNDATTEAINRALNNNPKGLILFQDELLAWINNLNQYRKGSDVEFWLSNWSNSAAKINRATKDTLFIPKPSVSVIGGLQPSVLDNLASGGKKDNGFLYRILFAYPEQQRKPYETNYSPDENIFESYKDIIFGLHKLPNQIEQDENGNWEIESILIRLSQDAETIYQQWNKGNTDAINDTNSESKRSLFGKMESYCLRFVLILELMEMVCNQTEIPTFHTISKRQMDNAIALTEYFRSTGMKVLNRVEKTDPLVFLSKDKREVYEALPDDFTTAEGVDIAKLKGMAKRTFKRFLTENGLFDRIKHGCYAKRY